MNRTSINVSEATRERLNRLARGRGMSQHTYLDQLLKEAEEAEFWRRMAEVSAEDYHHEVAADGDGLDEDYSLEEAEIRAEEQRG